MKKDKDKTATRRGKIMELVQQNKWTLGKLAEHLHKTNSEWLVAKNKPATYSTLADMKKKGWVVSRSDKGIINVAAK